MRPPSEAGPAPEDIIDTSPKLDSPFAVACACNEVAASMEQQAHSTRTGASAGHPYPWQLYGRAADVLRAAAALLAPPPPGAVLEPPAPPVAPPPPEAAWSPGAEAPVPPEKTARAKTAR